MSDKRKLLLPDAPPSGIALKSTSFNHGSARSLPSTKPTNTQKESEHNRSSEKGTSAAPTPIKTRATSSRITRPLAGEPHVGGAAPANRSASVGNNPSKSSISPNQVFTVKMGGFVFGKKYRLTVSENALSFVCIQTNFEIIFDPASEGYNFTLRNPWWASSDDHIVLITKENRRFAFSIPLKSWPTLRDWWKRKKP
jgi:hypothetical protein